MRAPRAGRRVSIVAPSSPFPSDRYRAGVEVLGRLGLEVKEHAFARASTGFLAGPDDLRVRALEEVLQDPHTDVVWAARGGYGLTRIAHRLGEAVAASDKTIVGFSDVCALHALARRSGLISIHGPVVTQLADLSPSDLANLEHAIQGRYGMISAVAEGPIVAGGRAEGRLAGGNLAVLAAMVGSEIFPDLRGAIVLLEDVGEPTYRLDRMLTQLILSRAFEGVAGFACGDFVGCEPRKPTEPLAIEVLSERLGGLGVPVLLGLPFGHGKRNLALPLGARAELDAPARTLRVLGP